MRRRKLPRLELVKISGIGAKGRAMALVEDKTILLDRGVPGDIVDLQVMRKKRKYFEGKVLAFHQYSDQRTEPFCQHFGVCGGCKWQDSRYEAQLQYKQEQVRQALEPLRTIDAFELRDILPAPATQFYRNKLEFTFCNRRWLSQEEIDSEQSFTQRDALGFHIPGLFDKVLDIETCYLQPEPSNRIRQALRAFALAHHLEFYDPKEHRGFLRTLIIRTSTTNETMVIVVFHHNDPENIGRVMDYLLTEFPEITALLYTINPKLNDTVSDLEMITWQGKESITEQLGELRFKVGPKSFFQTNTEQALRLYQVAAEFAGLSGHETVYDLYTGTGTIANFIARRAKRVIGIEYISEAIEDAWYNSRMNGIENTKFFSGDIKEVLDPEFIDREGRPDVLITDPPRAGMHPDVVQSILDIQPSKIVYVSCNPTTQAHDIRLLQSRYELLVAQPVDMFPHTYHVENVAWLQLRN